MTILLRFLETFLKMMPQAAGIVEDVIVNMKNDGFLSDTQKSKLLRSIRPAKDREIDSRIDDIVASKFPKD
jgi:hypothetical protein